MSANTTQPLEQRMRLALAGLFNYGIVDAQLLSEMKLIEDRSIPTAATDCYKTVKYNPDFFDPLGVNPIRTVLAHESRHKLYQHAARRGPRDPYLWNLAGDFIINAGLHQEGHDFSPWVGASIADVERHFQGQPPNHMLPGHSKAWIPLDTNTKPDDTTESIYERLEQAQQKGGGGQKKGKQAGGGNGEGNAPKGGAMTNDVDEKEWNDQAAQPGNSPEAMQRQVESQVGHALEAAKAMGSLPGHLERLATDILKPSVNWRNQLRRMMHGAYGPAALAGDYSYRRPNRRYAGGDIIRPSILPVPTRPVAVVVDVSGSIGQHELNVFASELRSILKDVRPSIIHVVYVDTMVRHHDTFEPDQRLELKAHGGGGTDLETAWPYLTEKCRDIAVAVVLTDGFTSYDVANRPQFPVIWGQTHNVEAPYGKNIKVQL